MGDRLRIAQIAPVGDPIFPASGGSIQQVVWLLTEELVRRGHEVTLFATGDSVTSAALHAEYPIGYEHTDMSDWRFHEVMNAAAAFERAARFDVIHSHIYHYALPFARLVETPSVHSYHILPDDDIAECFARYPEAHVVAISEYQRRAFPGTRPAGVVHHGIDVQAFPFSATRGDYLLYLGQLIPGKGPVEAVRLARRVGMPLVMAGPHGDEYEAIRDELEPMLRSPGVEYLGSVDVQRRNALLAGAAALLYPINAPEPFGLVLIEAMACGTPVAAIGIGAVPEIVENGVTGYYAADPALLLAALPDVLALDRTRVRRVAEERFDYRRMVDGYEGVYRRVICERQGVAS